MFLSHYLFPTLLTLLGLGMIYFKLVNQQTQYFLIGGLAITVVGVIMLLHAAGFIGRVLQLVLLILLVPATVIMGFFDYNVIKSKLDRMEKAEEVEQITIQGLKDIRKVQRAYSERYGKYAASHDSLLHFLKNDSITFVRAEGTRPDTLTEKEALEQGIIQRDTFFTPAIDTLFNPKSKKAKDRAYPFIVDSLPYKRGTGKKFIMDAGEVERSGGISSPVFVVKDPEPFEKNKDTLQVGSMREPKTSGNWGDYD